MEKINNYTTEKWTPSESEPRATKESNPLNPIYFKHVVSKHHFGKIIAKVLGKSKEEVIQKCQLIALAPTLYEQHFKMLELLKGDLYFIKIELKERLKFSDVNTDDKTKAMSDRIKELEQTIKECEL